MKKFSIVKCISNTRPNLFIKENDLVCSVCSNTTKKLIGRKEKEFLFRTKKSIQNNKTVMTA